MKKWGESMKHGYFVFTSNVDGQWAKAGIPVHKIEECHGTVHFLQCTKNCTDDIWASSETLKDYSFDHETFRAKDPLPECKHCKGLARPNVLMFGDWTWNGDRNVEQTSNNRAWTSSLKNKEDVKLVVVEIGAGKAVSTVRNTSEKIASKFKAPLIRINPRDADFPGDIEGISVELGGMKGCQEIDTAMKLLS